MDYKDIFPYETYRKSQEEVIQSIYRAFQAQEHSLLIAPNGTGKTVCNLAASLPIIMNTDMKLIYLCRTHSQNARVIEEITNINTKVNVEISAISIRGRKEMCIHKIVQKIKGSPTDIMNICSELRKNKNCRYYNKVMKLKRESKLSSVIMNSSIDAEELIQICINNEICPYFFARFMMQAVQVIVCNYQWIFNPDIRKTFLAGAKIELDKTIIIMDECHNLPDMLAEIDSSRLTTYALNQASKELRTNRAHIDYIRLVETWIDLINALEPKVKNEEIALNPIIILNRLVKDVRVDSIDELHDAIIDLKGYGEGLMHEKLSAGMNPIDFIGNVAQFMEKLVQIRDKDNYFFCIVPKIRKTGEKIFHLEIVALDPREISKEVFIPCYATCSCSGTLNAEIYIKLLGLDELPRITHVIEIDSPFPENHVKALLIDQLNTRYQNRSQKTFEDMNELISEVLFNTPKNVGIFCASYGILNALVKSGLLDLIRFSNKEVFIEESQKSASDNANMIHNFKSAAQRRGAVLLGVCGGRNSEGEDFPGDFMNAVVVVGFPFHKPTPRSDAKIKYYDEKFGSRKGWNYAYLGPAVKRANQAAGRPIRRLEDKGAIILMDNRFNQYRGLLSKWFAQNLIVVPNKPNKIAEQLSSFF
ncbi:MAG: DEAD/DEAH box helicase family protein [Candidatus Lokiarchaeota archaeon]|nr:DEAD/DEAH box helicase family protein [Candidatus Lokiarchaeota archaeon]